VAFKFPNDNVSFNVHRYHFRESPRFQNDIGPKVQAKSQEPATIEVTEISAFDFEHLLFALYAPIFKDYVHDNSDAHWTSVLKMSTYWGFPDLRQHSIKRMEKLKVEPVHKIHLYRSCSVDREFPSLLLPSYVELCERDAPITTEEGNFLTLDTVTKLFTIRENVLRSQLGSKPPKPENIADMRKKLVDEAFSAGAAPAVNGNGTAN